MLGTSHQLLPPNLTGGTESFGDYVVGNRLGRVTSQDQIDEKRGQLTGIPRSMIDEGRASSNIGLEDDGTGTRLSFFVEGVWEAC